MNSSTMVHTKVKYYVMQTIQILGQWVTDSCLMDEVESAERFVSTCLQSVIYHQGLTVRVSDSYHDNALLMLNRNGTCSIYESRCLLPI